jgi:hypothetical protein
MRKITTKILLAAALAALPGLVLATCGKIEDDRDTYTITFIATYTMKEKVDSWGNWDDYVPKPGEGTFETNDPNTNNPWIPPGERPGDEGPFEGWVWKTVEPEFPPIKTNTLGRLPYLPEDPEREDGYLFDGWFTPGGMPVTTLTVFSSDTSVFGKWKGGENIATVEDGPVAKELARIRNILATRKPSTRYIVDVTADETILPQMLYYGGTDIENVTIRLNGITPAGKTTPPIIALSGMGNLFAVGANVTLELRNVWLQGGSRNSMSLLAVNSGGKLIVGQNASDKTLIFNNGSENPRAGGGITVNEGGELIMNGGGITECYSINTTSEAGQFTGGGGVLVRGGTFTMNGGTMYRCEAENGGGVFVDRGGKFYLYGGIIWDNFAPIGGGVLIYRGGLFEMDGGEVYKNIAYEGAGVFVAQGRGGAISANPYDPRLPPGPDNDPAKKEGFYLKNGDIHENGARLGGGILNDSGAITYMTGGRIRNNSGLATAAVFNSGLFIMMDGTIEGNTGGLGGGVYAAQGIFIMENGKITKNSAAGSGGGILVAEYFIMHGGEISDNEAEEYCGGVYVNHSGSFAMSGGIIENNRTTSVSRANSGTLYFADSNTLEPSARGTAFYGTRPDGARPGNSIVDPIGHWLDGIVNGEWIIDSNLAEYDEEQLPLPYPNNTTIKVIDGVLTPIVPGE